GGSRRPHGLCRLRAGALRPGAVQGARLHAGPLAGRREAGVGTMMRTILPLDPAAYRRHSIHTGDRIWAETNCYVDLWIELLHAWGFEPVAALPFTLAIDFEGDQWTFFKFPLADLLELYGLDVQELALWRPLVRHVEQQIVQGRPVL